MTDSTTTEGRLQKSNCSKLGESKLQSLVQIEAAQKQANLFMLLGLKSYSQWFKGECSEVVDALSRDNNRSDKDLTIICYNFCKLQICKKLLKILLLPKEITSWLTALLHKLPVNPQYNEEHTQSKLGCGNNGGNIASSLETTTSASHRLHNTNKLNLLEHLPWLCMKGSFQESIMTNWLRKQSQIPFSMYA
jgi:hypothetical protein